MAEERALSVGGKNETDASVRAQMGRGVVEKASIGECRDVTGGTPALLRRRESIFKERRIGDDEPEFPDAGGEWGGD